MARVNAGDTLTIVYTSNGHTDVDPNPNPKQYGSYWSGQAGVDLTDRNQLGDATRLGPLKNFDDGTCGERPPRHGPCYGTFTIPEDTPTGTYQFVWWWVFDRDPRGAGEEYTTCFHVHVTGTN